MKIFAAIVNSEEFIRKLTTREREDFYYAGLAGLDVRLAYREPTSFEREVAYEAKAFGLELRTHAWTGLVRPPSNVDGEQGGQQGFMHGMHARELGAQMHSGNHENGVWRYAERVANPGANAFIREYGFGVKVNGILAGECGYGNPAAYYTSTHGELGKPKIDALTREPYARKHVMAYQNTSADIAKKLKQARESWPETPMSAWLGVGRIDSKGNMVGSADATEWVYRNAPSGIDEIVLYIGNGAWSQVNRGHTRHCSLTTLVRGLCAQKS